MPAERIRKLPLHSTKEVLEVLPQEYLAGIGAVCLAHARLELLTTQLLSDVLRIDYGLGGLAFREAQQPVEQLKTAVSILEFWDLRSAVEPGLENLIKECADYRNALVHGIWLKRPDGGFRLRITKGEYKTEDAGKVSCRLLPAEREVSDAYFKAVVTMIESALQKVEKLRVEVSAALERWPRTVPGSPTLPANENPPASG